MLELRRSHQVNLQVPSLFCKFDLILFRKVVNNYKTARVTANRIFITPRKWPKYSDQLVSLRPRWLSMEKSIMHKIVTVWQILWIFDPPPFESQDFLIWLRVNKSCFNTSKDKYRNNGLYLSSVRLIWALARAPDLHWDIHQQITSSNNSTQQPKKVPWWTKPSRRTFSKGTITYVYEVLRYPTLSNLSNLSLPTTKIIHF